MWNYLHCRCIHLEINKDNVYIMNVFKIEWIEMKKYSFVVYAATEGMFWSLNGKFMYKKGYVKFNIIKIIIKFVSETILIRSDLLL